ncbi:unnamed protein product [Oppiella nova]|uniref:Uncharacterized protein n=1 Tax=Oppiella nova TaxID=334625 RepID=A0A7R9M0T5_9ACAR|nr:unnamed protein product [Oppiella nova]CAG2168772.1 unnamed protein product [Oppiella nova]
MPTNNTFGRSRVPVYVIVGLRDPFDTLCPTLQKCTQITGHSNRRPLHSIHSPVIFSYRCSTWSSIIGHRTIRHLLVLTRSFTLNLFARHIHIQGQHLVINHRPPDYTTILVEVRDREIKI